MGDLAVSVAAGRGKIFRLAFLEGDIIAVQRPKRESGVKVVSETRIKSKGGAGLPLCGILIKNGMLPRGKNSYRPDKSPSFQPKGLIIIPFELRNQYTNNNTQKVKEVKKEPKTQGIQYTTASPRL